MKSLLFGLTMLVGASAHAGCMNNINVMNEMNGGSLCQGERVISDNGLIGTVSAIFPTGDVMVKFDGYSTFNKWPTSRLGRTTGCTEDSYCVEETVISDNGLRGRVAAIYRDGKVAVKFEGYSTYNAWPTNRLSKNEGCTKDEYCVGDTVISNNGLKGSIHAVDRRLGKVMVKFQGYSTFNQWPTDRLAKNNGCTQTGYCVNDGIISDNGLKGQVVAIFQDGEVAVKFEGYSSFNKWPTHRLAITEPTNERPMNNILN